MNALGSSVMGDGDVVHGTREGFAAGCRGSSCPSSAEGLSCRTAKRRYAGDHAFRKLVDAGLSPAEIVAAEGGLEVAQGAEHARRMVDRVVMRTEPVAETLEERPDRPKPTPRPLLSERDVSEAEVRELFDRRLHAPAEEALVEASAHSCAAVYRRGRGAARCLRHEGGDHVGEFGNGVEVRWLTDAAAIEALRGGPVDLVEVLPEQVKWIAPAPEGEAGVEYRDCSGCGEDVRTLSSRDLCDECEADRVRASVERQVQDLLAAVPAPVSFGVPVPGVPTLEVPAGPAGFMRTVTDLARDLGAQLVVRAELSKSDVALVPAAEEPVAVEAVSAALPSDSPIRPDVSPTASQGRTAALSDSLVAEGAAAAAELSALGVRRAAAWSELEAIREPANALIVKLAGLGMPQQEIATLAQISQGSVSDLLKARKRSRR